MLKPIDEVGQFRNKRSLNFPLLKGKLQFIMAFSVFVQGFAFECASTACRIALAPATVPSGCPWMPPPACKTTSLPKSPATQEPTLDVNRQLQQVKQV